MDENVAIIIFWALLYLYLSRLWSEARCKHNRRDMAKTVTPLWYVVGIVNILIYLHLQHCIYIYPLIVFHQESKTVDAVRQQSHRGNTETQESQVRLQESGTEGFLRVLHRSCKTTVSFLHDQTSCANQSSSTLMQCGRRQSPLSSRFPLVCMKQYHARLGHAKQMEGGTKLIPMNACWSLSEQQPHHN